MLINKSHLRILTVGFRYEKTFRIGDVSGQIFDSVLHDGRSPFGTEFFPRYQELNSQDKALFNGERGYLFRVTTSDTIFRFPLSENQASIDQEMEWFQGDAVAFIIDKILDGQGIKNIIRIGFMMTHVVEEQNVGGIVLSKLSSGDIKQADQFTLTFGRKDTTVDGLIKRGINDYINKITTIKQIDENKYDITLDYQYYFLPELSKMGGWPINSYFEKAYQYLNGQFYGMVNQLINEMAGVR